MSNPPRSDAGVEVKELSLFDKGACFHQVASVSFALLILDAGLLLGEAGALLLQTGHAFSEGASGHVFLLWWPVW